jgi:phosphatidylinositol alpha 1,6-mannosyltransferase
VSRLLDPAVRGRFGATARRSVLRRTWSTVGNELIAHYAAALR